MIFIADLHVHSRFSRATARNLDPEHLYAAAQTKGISVVATGDFTHPAWFDEIREKLVPEGTGLFRLKPEIEKACQEMSPESCTGEVRFILETEISNIYKKNDRTRKNHNLVYFSDLESAARFNARLDAIGNIKSDGRPILGLDARNLLEITLECSEDAIFIPAHIWTPWFSLFGSKSGFDSLEECFEDLSDEIFAVETGLSSDPPMNWRISELDSRALVSNSDAHSPDNIGRNANLFDTERSFSAIRSALKSKDPARCLGTLDLYPEEGKYHLDGHRKCGVVMRPEESIALDGICPECGKPLTLGVLHRVAHLANRPLGEKPPGVMAHRYIIPLPEILSEILGVGPKSKKVATHYQAVLRSLGSELDILLNRSIEALDRTGVPLLGEAVRRMRAGEIHIEPGYDGEYGRITVFAPHEKEELMAQRSLFQMDVPSPAKKKRKVKSGRIPTKNNLPKSPITAPKKETTEKKGGILDALNPEQQEAVLHTGSPLLIIAGPGAGKTRTLTHRIAWLIREQNVPPERILAVTFTSKAAREMQERLKSLLDNQKKGAPLPTTATFHALCLAVLRENGWEDYAVMDEEDRAARISDALRRVKAKGAQTRLRAAKLSEMISAAKTALLKPEDDPGAVAESENAVFFSQVYHAYQERVERGKCLDFDDLILNTVRLFQDRSEVREAYAGRFAHILVDEYQDLNLGQYRLIRDLAGDGLGLCVIGDPDQAIYGFRGADLRFFSRFEKDYPDVKTIRLNRNYRSAESILESSHQVIREHALAPGASRVYSGIDGVRTISVMELPTEKAEAVAVGKIIEEMTGGLGFYSVDFGKAGYGQQTEMAFSDFAVLYRSNAQASVIAETFEKAGIPFQVSARKQLYGLKPVSALLSWLRMTEGMGRIGDPIRILRMEYPRLSPNDLTTFKDRLTSEETIFPQALKGKDALPPECRMLRVRIAEFMETFTGISVPDKLETLIARTAISETAEDKTVREALNAVIAMSRFFSENSRDFLDAASLQTDPDVAASGVEKVSLMTLHAAKGLEFPVVFITGCEDDLLPFHRPGKETDLGEERRLFYVGMTRAKERLFLTRASTRVVFGRKRERSVSPFVHDIEERLLNRLPSDLPTKPKKQGHQQLGLFL